MYQIGEFSRICQVSVKALRYYDRIGILRPSAVDPSTGYRYYDRSQLDRMLLIQELKRYGFSLEEIQPLLSCDGRALYGALLRQRERLEERRLDLEMAIQGLTRRLRELERTGDIMNDRSGYVVTYRASAPMAVVSCRRRMGVDEFGQWYGTLYERIAKEGLTPDGVTGAMYHDEEFHEEASDIELFVGVRERERADRILEARECAMTVHRGAWSSLSEAYAALAERIREDGRVWDGAPFDLYVKTPHDGYAPQDCETEVWCPVR